MYSYSTSKPTNDDVMDFHISAPSRLPYLVFSSTDLPSRMKSSIVNRYPHTFEHLSHLTTRDFSEFNALGAYIDRYENDQYYVSDTTVWVPEPVAKQYWSWGGITPRIQAEINKFLSGGAS